MTNLTAIVDLQFGSTGKGLIAGYLSLQHDYDTVVSANMPNAGHTFVDEEGLKWVNKVLPSGVYSPGLKVIGIGPGAVFNPFQLSHELEELNKRTTTNPRIIIHEAAAILHEEHIKAEAKLNHIASTMQGSAEAMIEKIRRKGLDGNTVGFNAEYLAGIKTSLGKKLSEFIVSAGEWNRVMLDSRNMLVEGSQGYSLGINAGFYPYCTSRDCTVWRLLSDCAIPATRNLIVVGSARVHPIRVGHTHGGHSGPSYPDQTELSWETLGVEPEKTTVTGRVRRVFSFSEQQIRDAVNANCVDKVFLNFCNYDPKEAVRVGNIINQIGKETYERRGMGQWNKPPQFVRYFGFGPKASEILEVYDAYSPF